MNAWLWLSVYILHLRRRVCPYIIFHLNKHLNVTSRVVSFLLTLAHFKFFVCYLKGCFCVFAQVCDCEPNWLRMYTSVVMCTYVCTYIVCVCVCARLVGRNRLIPPELRHCWNLATGARGLPPQRGWLPRHIHYQPRILGWIKNSCCLQQQKAPR